MIWWLLWWINYCNFPRPCSSMSRMCWVTISRVASMHPNYIPTAHEARIREHGSLERAPTLSLSTCARLFSCNRLQNSDSIHINPRLGTPFWFKKQKKGLKNRETVHLDVVLWASSEHFLHIFRSESMKNSCTQCTYSILDITANFISLFNEAARGGQPLNSVILYKCTYSMYRMYCDTRTACCLIHLSL